VYSFIPSPKVRVHILCLGNIVNHVFEDLRKTKAPNSDDVEQVHADVSACIAVADAPVLWTYETATCLIGVDFSDYQFISIDKNGFIPVMLKPMENQLNPK
jgi:hypothetical protein